ncbi:MAG: hypothetical protein GY804_01275 [Alphaproteobacteria bacterium]|nr:hypothetical protein [Alphaproteobacteria bacterium]
MLNVFMIILAFIILLIAFPFIFFVFYLAPPVPSTNKSRCAVVDNIHKHAQNAQTILEIGSGWGGMTRMAAKSFPDKKIISYEISLVPYLFTRIVFLIFPCKNVELHYGDAFKAIDKGEIKPECTIFYLCSGLEEKMAQYKGMIISVNFPIKNRQSLANDSVDDVLKSSVYVYSGR